MRSRSRSPTSAPTPASRSPSGRRAAPCSSRPLTPGVACREYAPARVKQAVCGYGRAEKAQVQRMVKAILGARRAPDAEPRRRRARRRDLPRARAAAAAGGRSMIARLRGKPVARTPDGLVLDVGGVGYLVHATPAARARADGRRDRPSRRTSTSARTRCSSTASPTARSASSSSSCSSVNGVGPKVALAIVSGSPAGRAAPRDRARGHGALPGDPRDRQEDGPAHRARAEGEARRPALGAGAASGDAHVVARDALVELGYSLARRRARARRRRPRRCRRRNACASR